LAQVVTRGRRWDEKVSRMIFNPDSSSDQVCYQALCTLQVLQVVCSQLYSTEPLFNLILICYLDDHCPFGLAKLNSGARVARTLGWSSPLVTWPALRRICCAPSHYSNKRVSPPASTLKQRTL